jgi:hypothetical protein
MHHTDIDDARFKVGERVKINTMSPNLEKYNGIITEITGVSLQWDGQDVFEYYTKDCPWALWEYDLEKVVSEGCCNRCGAPKQTFVCNYCSVASA